MADAVRTVVTFSSSAFNTMEPRPHFINECCFGDDVAEWLIGRLRAQGVTTDEPGQEDFGWFFNFHVGDAGYCLVIGFRPDDDAGAGTWVCFIERSLGLIASLLGRRNKGLTPDASRTIHRALSGSAEVRDVRWHVRQEFDRGLEDRGTAEP